MIILSGTSDAVRITLAGSTTTNALELVYSYVDTTTTTVTPVGSSATQSATGPTSVSGSPASSTQRVIKYFSVCNTDTVSATVTLTHYNGTNDRRLWKGTLAAVEAVVYTETTGWTVFDATGIPKLST